MLWTVMRCPATPGFPPAMPGVISMCWSRVFISRIQRLNQPLDLLGEGVERVADDDALVAVGAYGNDVEGHLEEPAEGVHVALRSLGEVVPAPRPGGVGLPTGVFFVVRLYLFQQIGVGGQVVQVGVIELVSGAYLY